jgi:hypothetical protein
MKIRKAIKLTLSGAAMAAPFVVLAGPPGALTFSDYVRNPSTGIITSTDSNCSDSGVSEADFAQFRCVDTVGGGTYIQTIQDSGPGAEVFKDNSFVAMGSSVGGIASQSSLTETSGTETFKNKAQLNTGEFFVNQGIAGTAWGQGRINLDQKITEGSDFSTGFNFIEGLGDTSTFVDGHDATWTDMTLTNNVADTSGTYTGSFKMNVLNIETDTASASYLAAAAADGAIVNGRAIDIVGNLIDPGATITQLFSLNERQGSYSGLGSGTGGTVSWTAGETIIDLEIGQDVGGAGAFGLHDFTNESTGLANGVDSQVTSNTSSLMLPLYDGAPAPAANQANTTWDPFATF